MFPYFIMLALISFCAFTIYILNISQRQKDKAFLFISFFILTFFSAFRGKEVGTDTDAYMDIFLKYVYGYSDPHSEVGYSLFNQFLSYISTNPQAIIIASSIIINLGFMHFIYHNSKNAWISVYIYVTLFYYFYSFNAMRQFIAISIVLFAWNFLKNGKIIRFILIVLLASTFHTTALISFLLIFVYLWRRSIKLIPFIVLSTVVAVFGTSAIFNFVADFFPRYAIYSETAGERGLGGIMPVILYFTIFIALYILREKGDQEYNMILNIAAICAAFGILSYFNFLFYRPAFFFNVFSIIFIPHIASRFKVKEYPIAVYIISSLGMLYMIYYLAIGWHDVTPYKVFLLE